MSKFFSLALNVCIEIKLITLTLRLYLIYRTQIETGFLISLILITISCRVQVYTFTKNRLL